MQNADLIQLSRKMSIFFLVLLQPVRWGQGLGGILLIGDKAICLPVQHQRKSSRSVAIVQVRELLFTTILRTVHCAAILLDKA